MAFLMDDNAVGGQLMVGAGQPGALGVGPNKIRGSAFVEGPLQVGNAGSFGSVEATMMIGPDKNSDSKNPDRSLFVKGNVKIEGDTRHEGNLTRIGTSRFNGVATFNQNVKMNKILNLANCGNVAQQIKIAKALPRSDERLKKNIQTIDNALEKVLSLRGVEFDFISGGKHQIGVIAQEVEKIVPEVVEENFDGYSGVDYQKLVSLLIEAVKEQQKQIENLKNLIEEK
jgi:hypothetical protein